MYRVLHIQNIYHRAKFECSSFSSLANTRRGGGGGLKGPSPVLQVTKSPGAIGLRGGIPPLQPERVFEIPAWIPAWIGLTYLSIIKWILFLSHKNITHLSIIFNLFIIVFR